MLVNLNQIFSEYPQKCVAGFNVFGFEDAQAVIDAAEELKDPVILMANKVAIDHTPIPIIAPLLLAMAKRANVPVCVHLDHSTSIGDISLAIECGFTSVMFDGSQLPYAENVRLTRAACALAHSQGVSVEAEIGSVGYSDSAVFAKTVYTEPDEALKFYNDTLVDAMAVSVGTLHRQVVQDAHLQFDRLDKIHAAVNVPLVIHGSTSVKNDELTMLAKHGVKKINLGTCLRLKFGNTLRQILAEDDKIFDRVEMFKKCMPAVYEEALLKMRLLDAK